MGIKSIQISCGMPDKYSEQNDGATAAGSETFVAKMETDTSPSVVSAARPTEARFFLNGEEYLDLGDRNPPSRGLLSAVVVGEDVFRDRFGDFCQRRSEPDSALRGLKNVVSYLGDFK
jgi:hypothetical protein